MWRVIDWLGREHKLEKIEMPEKNNRNPDLPPKKRSTSRVSFPVKGRRRTHHEAEAIH